MPKCVRYLAISFSLILLVLCSCKSKTIQLWNGKDFNGWKFFVADSKIDVNKVWSIKNGVIHCKGVPNGYMRTESDYSNYILYLEWRWVENESNSGILLHAQEPDLVWPRCIECQLKSGNAGDFVLIGAGTITVDGEKYTNTERFLAIPKKQESTEKQIGKWNSYKIICRDDEITCYVNNVLQNRGTQTSLTKGKICIQSEGAPIEFRNIRLELFD
ncbi:MAG: DUF1080 domain-containing protein [Candidatus Latescibacteria bacterium]|jgi:hypothetical protein|nr:DUF1080 domain-containing protein [Candidatus Latescibacterota bacterium]